MPKRCVIVVSWVNGRPATKTGPFDYAAALKLVVEWERDAGTWGRVAGVRLLPYSG